ncbi:MAG TPA: hypothetical protein VIV11_20940 [Kofleriaceae bacterium]
MVKVFVLGCALVAAACNLDQSGKTRCDLTTDCLAGYSCVGGECVMTTEQPDAGTDAMPDGPPMCVQEPSFIFCSRYGATCGVLTAEDNCGAQRTEACGTCGGNLTCGSSNVCGCEPETPQELCTAAMAQCGSITAVDKCGATRTLQCANTCSGTSTCGGGWAENACGSTTCTADGWCRPTTSSISQLYDFKAVWIAAANNGWAAGEYNGGFIYRWNGTTWRRVLTSNRGLYAIAGNGLTDAWIGGGYGVTYHYDGTSLTSGSAGCFSCDVFDMWSLGAQDIWGVGYDHKAMHFEGSGWGVTTMYPVPAAPRAVWAAAPNDVWVVGDAGRIRHWNGADWTSVQVGTEGLLDVWGTSATDIWAVGTNGRILRYNGTTWNPVASGTTQTLSAITGTASNRVWFAGGNGVILHWNGSTLTPQQSGTTRAIKSMWALSPTDIWAAGDDGLLLHKQ